MYGQTFIYVTHDQIEAMTVGQRIALLNGGDLQMLDTPHNVYHRPANIFVAKFIGSPSMNIINVHLDGRELVLGEQRTELPEMWLNQIHQAKHNGLRLGIRPENMLLTREKSQYCIEIDIKYIENYGNRVGFYTEIEDEEMISIMPENEFSVGEKVYWNILPNKLHFSMKKQPSLLVIQWNYTDYIGEIDMKLFISSLVRGWHKWKRLHYG